MTAPPADAAAATALVAAEAATSAQIVNLLTVGLLQLWRDLTNFYDPAQLADFGARAAALVRHSQRLTGQLAEQHLRMQLQQLGVALPAGPVVGLPDDLRFGALTPDVYLRPAATVRYLTSLVARPGEQPQVEAISAGELRLLKLMETDLQLARTTAAQQTMYATPGARGYRRIIHPEVSGQVCGMCIVASDRVYGRIQKMELHPGCHCTVLPIVGGRDPGRELNLLDLKRIYKAAGSTKAADLRRTRVQVSEHGELGPVLTVKGQAYRDPGDAARESTPSAAEQRRRALKAQSQALRGRLGAGTTSPTQRAWLDDRLKQLDELLAAA